MDDQLGLGAMNPTAIKATKINYPMDHFIGIWWSGSERHAAIGSRCQGLPLAQSPRRRAELPGTSGHPEICLGQG
jgi:hypothetical protein